MNRINCIYCGIDVGYENEGLAMYEKSGMVTIAREFICGTCIQAGKHNEHAAKVQAKTQADGEIVTGAVLDD